jgi:hypothetical protein
MTYKELLNVLNRLPAPYLDCEVCVWVEDYEEALLIDSHAIGNCHDLLEYEGFYLEVKSEA